MPPKIPNPADNLNAYLKRLQDELKTAKNPKRIADLKSAVAKVQKQLADLNKPSGGIPTPPQGGQGFNPAGSTDPFSGLGLTNDQIIGITNSLSQMGYSKPGDLASLSGKYMQGWQKYELNKQKYATWWKQIYGTDLPQFGFANNPFAVAEAVGAGNFMGYDLAKLTSQANALEGLSQGYTALGQAGSWQGGVEQLGFEQFRELAAMFGSTTPTQGEFAQLKAPSSTFQFQGADWNTWGQRYEDWRKKRQTLYSSEEGKVSYQNTDESFTATGLKSRQQY